MSSNIKCGNSLIGPDFYEQQLNLLDEEERLRINAFDWHTEFAEIMKAGGFDAVIGNPPYVFGGNYGIESSDKLYFKGKYVSGAGKVNLFTLFIEKSARLLRSGGLVSVIIPNTLLRVTSYSGVREFILTQTAVKQIVDLGTGVFSGAVTSSIVILLERQKGPLENIIEIRIGLGASPQLVKQKEFVNDGFVFNIRTSVREQQVLTKIKKRSQKLGALCKELIFGVVITKNRDIVVSDKRKSGYKPFLEGRDISRYLIRPTSKYLLYEPKLLHRPRTPEVFESPEKLLIQRITGGKRPLNVAYDNSKYYNKESINNLILDDEVNYSIKFILGLMNSTLINWFYKSQFTNESILTVNISKEYLSQIPIATINFSDPADKSRHDRMVALVERMLGLHQQLAAAKIGHDKTALQRQIEATDKQIDQLVYELYGLSEEEIKIVEESK